MDGERCEYLILNMDTVQKHKGKQTNQLWHHLRPCKVIVTDESFFLEQWGRRDRKKYYMDKAKFEKMMLLEGDMIKGGDRSLSRCGRKLGKGKEEKRGSSEDILTV